MLIGRKARRHSSLKSLQHANDVFIVDEVCSNAISGHSHQAATVESPPHDCARFAADGSAGYLIALKRKASCTVLQPAYDISARS